MYDVCLNKHAYKHTQNWSNSDFSEGHFATYLQPSALLDTIGHG